MVFLADILVFSVGWCRPNEVYVDSTIFGCGGSADGPDWDDVPNAELFAGISSMVHVDALDTRGWLDPVVGAKHLDNRTALVVLAFGKRRKGTTA